MASRSRTLAAALVTAISAWGSLPVGVTVQRVRSVTQLVQDLPDTGGVIAVITSRRDDAGNRADVADDVAVGIVLLARCSSSNAADSDTWDDCAELLADHLRTSAVFRNIAAGGSLAFQRKEIATPVLCDAEILIANEVFCSVIEGTWFVSVGNRA